jgi:hypothetical protein
MTDAIPVWGVAVASEIPTLQVAFFTEIRREFIEKAALAFHNAALSELKGRGAVMRACMRLYQAQCQKLLEGCLYLPGFEVQQAIQLFWGDVLAEIFSPHPVHHLQDFVLR